MDLMRQGQKQFAIIIDQLSQSLGAGQKVLEYLKTHNESLNGWVIKEESRYVKKDGSPYPLPLSKYLKHGFEICTGELLVTDKINAVKVIWRR